MLDRQTRWWGGRSKKQKRKKKKVVMLFSLVGRRICLFSISEVICTLGPGGGGVTAAVGVRVWGVCGGKSLLAVLASAAAAEKLPPILLLLLLLLLFPSEGWSSLCTSLHLHTVSVVKLSQKRGAACSPRPMMCLFVWFFLLQCVAVSSSHSFLRCFTFFSRSSLWHSSIWPSHTHTQTHILISPSEPSPPFSDS